MLYQEPTDFFKMIEKFHNGEYGNDHNREYENERKKVYPPYEFTEYEDHGELKIEIPGVDKENIEISYSKESDSLTVKVKKEESTKENSQKVVSTIEYFESRIYEFKMPYSIDEESLEATYRNGVLKISFKKATEKDTRKIKVK